MFMSSRSAFLVLLVVVLAPVGLHAQSQTVEECVEIPTVTTTSRHTVTIDSITCLDRNNWGYRIPLVNFTAPWMEVTVTLGDSTCDQPDTFDYFSTSTFSKNFRSTEVIVQPGYTTPLHASYTPMVVFKCNSATTACVWEDIKVCIAKFPTSAASMTASNLAMGFVIMLAAVAAHVVRI